MTDTDTNRETAARSADENAWEEMLIADLRANGGRPSQGPLQGHPIIVLYSTGAKSGERRRSVLTISNDGDAYVVAGTAGGFDVHAVVGGEPRGASRRRIRVRRQDLTGRAEVIREGAERDRLWDQQSSAPALRGVPGADRSRDPGRTDRHDRRLSGNALSG